MFVSAVWTLRCKIDSGYITLQCQETGVLAGGADPFVKTRILTVLINFRSHWRKKMKTDMPAGRGQGDGVQLRTQESLMLSLSAASASVIATGQKVLDRRLYWIPVGDSNSFSLPYLC